MDTTPPWRHPLCQGIVRSVSAILSFWKQLTENQRTVPTYELSYTKYDRYTGYITYIK